MLHKPSGAYSSPVPTRQTSFESLKMHDCQLSSKCDPSHRCDALRIESRFDISRRMTRQNIPWRTSSLSCLASLICTSRATVGMSEARYKTIYCEPRLERIELVRRDFFRIAFYQPSCSTVQPLTMPFSLGALQRRSPLSRAEMRLTSSALSVGSYAAIVKIVKLGRPDKHTVMFSFWCSGFLLQGTT